MKLSHVYAHLRATAAATPGRWKRHDLRGGAQVAVRVDGAQVRVCLSRPEKELSATELATFAAHLQIPAAATRTPSDPSRQATAAGRYYIIFTWEDAPPAGAPQPEGGLDA